MLHPTYKGNFSDTANDNRLHSGNIWGDCPTPEELRRRGGCYLFDDFDAGGLITSPTTHAALVGTAWSGFGSANSTITWDDSQYGGIILTETTVDEGVVLTHEQHPFVISNVSGSFWYESRIKLAFTATTENAWFAGLMDTTACTASVPMVCSTGAMATATTNYVGHHKPEANTTAWDTVYNANGMTEVETNADVGTHTGGTYFKVGMKKLAKDNILRFYIEGLQCAATKTIVDALGTTFPSDIGLGFAFAISLGAAGGTNAVDSTLTVDWVAGASSPY